MKDSGLRFLPAAESALQRDLGDDSVDNAVVKKYDCIYDRL